MSTDPAPPRASIGRVVAARVAAALVVATLIWLPLMRFVFTPAAASYSGATGVPELARRMVRGHLALWSDPKRRADEVDRMRLSNAEWDFMGRTYLILALANIGLREPAQVPQLLPAMDFIIDETVKVEQSMGFRHFMMPYAHDRPYVTDPARSVFVDGELALMMAARRAISERAELAGQMRERLAHMEAQMRAGPALCGESYPDECWIFCNTVALAAMRASDNLDGTDHAVFFRDWVAMAKKRLADPTTGILWSSFSLDARVKDGPEGSSIWMAAHCLQLVDEAFAHDQYERARKELGRTFLGFGWAREWPASWRGASDVDSGPIIPILEASAGSSGLALLGAASFGDADYLAALHASLELAAFPIDDASGRRYAASNQVGDSVMLYSMVQGPLWERFRAPRQNRESR